MRRGFILLFFLVVVLDSCGTGIKWERHVIDGSLTGVTAPVGDNVESSLGKIEGDVYVAPNGKVFTSGTIVLTAKYMIEAQEDMADLKSVVGFAPFDMILEAPESELSNFVVDNMMQALEEALGRKVDIGITNFGGIRVDIHKGIVLKDDIVSMLPFRNHLVFLTLKGKDVLDIFKQMARQGVQVVGGVHLVVKGQEVKELIVRGEPLDMERLYTIATIDYLVENGDGYSLGKEAKELIMTDLNLCDIVLSAVLGLTSQGKMFEYQKDGRVEVLE